MVTLVFITSYNLKFPIYSLNKEKYTDKFEKSRSYLDMYEFIFDNCTNLNDAVIKTIKINRCRKSNNFIYTYRKSHANKK